MILVFWLFLVVCHPSGSATHNSAGQMTIQEIQVINRRLVELVGIEEASTNYLYVNDVNDYWSSAEHVHLDLDGASHELTIHHSSDVFVAVVREIGGLAIVYTSGLMRASRDVVRTVLVREHDFVLAVLPSKVEERVRHVELDLIMDTIPERKAAPFISWLHNITSRLPVTNTVVIASFRRDAPPKEVWWDGHDWTRYFSGLADLTPLNAHEFSIMRYLLGSLHVDSMATA